MYTLPPRLALPLAGWLLYLVTVIVNKDLLLLLKRGDYEVRYMQRRNYKPLNNVPAIKMSSTAVWFFVLLWPESHPFIHIDQMSENYKRPAPFTLVYRPICISPVNLIIIRSCNAVTLTHWPLTQNFCAGTYMCALLRDFSTCCHFIL